MASPLRKLHAKNVLVLCFLIFIILNIYWYSTATVSGNTMRERLEHKRKDILSQYLKNKTNLKMFANSDELTMRNSQKATNIIYINPHNFKYIINNPVICSKDTFLIAFVHSAPNKGLERLSIRKTWASVKGYKGRQMRTIFLIAKPSSKETQNMITEENNEFGDIIQEDFLDGYRNLTYKHIMGLKWIGEFCPQAKYILKTDDDTLVNPYRLVDYLLQTYGPDVKDFMYCSVFQNQGPRRDKKDKWYVSFEEYNKTKYPPYCEGFAYVMSSDLVPKLYNASLNTKYYWVDDVYVTGILAKKLGIKHQTMRPPNGYSYMDREFNEIRIFQNIFLLAKYKGMRKEWFNFWNGMETNAQKSRNKVY